MSYYDSNMKEIQRTKGFLYERIIENISKPHPNKPEKLELYPALDGDTMLVITFGSSQYRLNSLYSPSHEAERWAEQYDMKNIGIVATMFGFGNGIFVRSLLRKLDGQGALLIYEPSAELFFYVLEHYDLTDILGATNVSITVEGINDNEIRNILSNHVDWINLRSQIFCSHPLYEQIFEDSAKTLYKVIQDNNDRTVVNKNTDVALSKRLVSNTLVNMKHMRKSNLVTDLIGKFPKDIPAIIVAAGPSLDKNIEELKRAKGKAVIFAVDTAMKYLLAHEILPDFIVTLDPKKSLKHLKDPRCHEIPMFSRIDSRPQNIETNKKKIIFYNLEGYIKALYSQVGKETGSFYSGGSVATGAFSICETLGFQRIILIGQDLAYSGDSTHAGGISVDYSNAGTQIEIVEDIYGNPIKTRYDWYVYIRWFEDAVDLFEGEEVIDATEGGARIKGTTIMTLKDTIDRYCNQRVDCESIIAALKPTINTEELRILIEQIKQDINDLEDIRQKAEEAADICDRLIEKYDKSLQETTSSIRKNQILSEYNAAMEAKPVYELIDWDISAATTEQLSHLYVYTKDEKKNKLATYEQARVIYRAILESILWIGPALVNGLSYLEE